MKASINRMIKQSLMDGFRRSKFDIQKTIPELPKGRFLTPRQDVHRAYQVALTSIQVWQIKARSDPTSFPSSPKEIEKYIDIFIAESSFLEANSMINLQLRDRSNEELLTEARDAINELKRLGETSKASSYEWVLKSRIGEE